MLIISYIAKWTTLLYVGITVVKPFAYTNLNRWTNQQNVGFMLIKLPFDPCWTREAQFAQMFKDFETESACFKLFVNIFCYQSSLQSRYRLETQIE